MEAAILAAISTVLTVIETILPTLTAGSTAGSVVVALVSLLEKWVPIITSELPSAVALFDSIKGAIAALAANPATPAEQLATLQQLDAQVDAAFEAAAALVDPDAAVPSTTSATTGA